jgi:hypothetical protein
MNHFMKECVYGVGKGTELQEFATESDDDNVAFEVADAGATGHSVAPFKNGTLL